MKGYNRSIIRDPFEETKPRPESNMPLAVAGFLILFILLLLLA